MRRLQRNPNFSFEASEGNACSPGAPASGASCGEKVVDVTLRKARSCGVLDVQGMLLKHENLTLADLVSRYYLANEEQSVSKRVYSFVDKSFCLLMWETTKLFFLLLAVMIVVKHV